MTVKLFLSTSRTSSSKLRGLVLSWLVELSIVVFCLGVCVAYVVAVGDILEEGVLGNIRHHVPSFVNRESAMIVFWALVMFPLSLNDRINDIRFASLFGMVSIAFLVLVVTYHSAQTLVSFGTGDFSPQNIHNRDGHIRLFPNSLYDVMASCPIIVFAFNCQVNVPQIFSELRAHTIHSEPSTHPYSHPSKLAEMKKVTRNAVFLCFVAYLMVGVFAYLEFGSRTQGTILKNFCVHITHDPIVSLAFFGITISVIMAFPLNVLPCRTTLESMIGRCRAHTHTPDHHHDATDRDHPLDEPMVLSEPLMLSSPPNPPPTTNTTTRTLPPRHYVLTLLISGFALLVALIVPDISVVFSILGGFCSSFLGFVLPALFFLQSRKQPRPWMVAGARILLIIGIVMGTTTTAFTIWGLWENQTNQEDVCRVDP